MKTFDQFKAERIAYYETVPESFSPGWDEGLDLEARQRTAYSIYQRQDPKAGYWNPKNDRDRWLRYEYYVRWLGGKL